MSPEHKANIGDSASGVVYYASFFLTVISDAYEKGETNVPLSPGHVAVLKNMLSDYGMLECRRTRRDPTCKSRRRVFDTTSFAGGRNADE